MKHTIFGESHGPAIGVVLESVPAGLRLDPDFIRSELSRRAPGGPLATARREADEPRFLSGVLDGVTTGAPLCAVIENTDTRSGDYADLRAKPRPSHSDFAARIRYDGCNDLRGGGHFSGRLTAPLVLAGAIAKLALRARGIEITSRISRLGGVSDPDDDTVCRIISDARDALDSVGGAIECVITGLPAGLGAPDYGENLEGRIAAAVFAVPAVKAVAFGAGFGFADMRGSRANDPFRIENGAVVTETNNSGGINGGISNGMPVVFEVAIRPTPSIGLPQKTVDLDTGENAQLTVKGRHDPCILPRALPVIEAAAALEIMDAMQAQYGVQL